MNIRHKLSRKLKITERMKKRNDKKKGKMIVESVIEGRTIAEKKDK